MIMKKEIVIKKELCQRMKEAMDREGIRQIELSRKTGISKSLISQYLSGRAQPKYERLELIAKALNVSASWLIGAESNPYTTFIELVLRDVDFPLQKFIEEFNEAFDKNITVEYLFELGNVRKCELTKDALSNLEALVVAYSCKRLTTDYASKAFLENVVHEYTSRYISSNRYTDEEKAVLKAYREHPELQRSVKLLLGLEKIDE